MHIHFFEVQGFRKLRSVRVDLNETTTLFVGANNSGKTSAMEALSRFLIRPKLFTTNDFTLSNWVDIDGIGERWLKEVTEPSPAGTAEPTWDDLVPTLDLWIAVEENELHYVKSLLPTLDWTGGSIGVRLRFEPKKIEELKAEFLSAASTANKTKAAASEKAGGGKEYTLNLWPNCMRSFLDRRLLSQFVVQAYLLDPALRQPPVNGVARPQPLPVGSEPIEGNPLSRLIRINEIGAQRGLGDRGTASQDEEEAPAAGRRGKLSGELRSYYDTHLDPSEFPEPVDLVALEAIEAAQKAYDERLTDGFADSLQELKELNYPGVTDPVLKLATRLRPVDGLNHSAAVQYEVMSPSGEVRTTSLTLPEEYNGLGYQNLILMVFRLMSFRDAWMRVGKAAKKDAGVTGHLIPPLHLVLIEEPEAHLHVQVQQVFVRKARQVLRKHKELGEKTALRTQLLVSTHSSHIAHECEFAWLRYFRRLPAEGPKDVPTSAVINLSEVFGADNETSRFVARYLLSTHCELFFADAAIFVEGAAERMLVPHFIKYGYPVLHRSYVTLSEIGGSHAFQLRPLIESLGLTTLVIGDLDSIDPSKNRLKAAPKRGSGLVTSNETLKQWHPAKEKIDELLDVAANDKVLKYAGVKLFSVRMAYQVPASVTFKGNKAEILSRTFEDALAVENLAAFATMPGSGTAKKFTEAVKNAENIADLETALFDAVDKCDKAAFALDLLFLSDPKTLKVPTYIREGLEWLVEQLKRKDAAVLATAPTKPAEGCDDAAATA